MAEVTGSVAAGECEALASSAVVEEGERVAVSEVREGTGSQQPEVSEEGGGEEEEKEEREENEKQQIEAHTASATSSQQQQQQSGERNFSTIVTVPHRYLQYTVILMYIDTFINHISR